jgi:hypothetical protein
VLQVVATHHHHLAKLYASHRCIAAAHQVVFLHRGRVAEVRAHSHLLQEPTPPQPLQHQELDRLQSSPAHHKLSSSLVVVEPSANDSINDGTRPTSPLHEEPSGSQSNSHFNSHSNSHPHSHVNTLDPNSGDPTTTAGPVSSVVDQISKAQAAESGAQGQGSALGGTIRPQVTDVNHQQGGSQEQGDLSPGSGGKEEHGSPVGECVSYLERYRAGGFPLAIWFTVLHTGSL